MLNYDFSPLFPSTIGFERLQQLLESAAQADQSAQSYPPYNIEKTGEDAYRITMAVAGFEQDDLAAEVRENALVVTGRKKDADEGVSYLHRGIAGRDFVRTFQLADHVRVENAYFRNGLLYIDLVREIPEALKPRRIEIKSSMPTRLVEKARKLIEGDDKKAA